MSTKEIISTSGFFYEFKRSNAGIAGVVILLFLIIVSIYAFVAIPLDSFRQWNNPNYWIKYPKSAMPEWTNFFTSYKEPKHLIMNDAIVTYQLDGGIRTVKYYYTFTFNYDSFPNDFMINYAIQYNSIPPLVDVQLRRPDGELFTIISTSLPPAQTNQYVFRDTIFSTESGIKDSLRTYVNEYSYNVDVSRPQVMLFSAKDKPNVLKGTYTLIQTFSFFDEKGKDRVLSSEFILGGKVYGVIAAYKGKKTDQGMMVLVQILSSIPTLPILIILSVSIGKNIFLIVGFLIIFSWLGQALVSRSMGLQVKNLQYVEAAKLMGESDVKIVFRHIIPQLLPYVFASIALSVPAAILAEAGLSFFGLGDPTIPTLGQIFHDAESSSAAARGLWWWILPPGIMIGITGTAFVLIARALDSIINPKLRRV